MELTTKAEEVRVLLEVQPGTGLGCFECGASCPEYDTRRRSWRHRDTCQFKTIIEADVPRVECPTHGVRQVDVPWAEAGSGFTALMETLIIDWLKEASTQAVARLMRLLVDSKQEAVPLRPGGGAERESPAVVQCGFDQARG